MADHEPAAENDIHMPMGKQPEPTGNLGTHAQPKVGSPWVATTRTVSPMLPDLDFYVINVNFKNIL